jgi:hypothetical protein
MGTERDVTLDIPCSCGKGRIKRYLCGRDHAYAHEGQMWHENEIECSDCEAKYKVVEQAKKLVLVSREDYEQNELAQKQKQQEMDRLKKELWENLEKTGVLDSVVGYLNSFRTAAAAYRHLSDLYICRDVDDFRTKFPKQNCTKERVRQYVYPRALEKVLARMQTPSKILEQYFKDDSLVQNRTIPIPKPIGDPILVLNR